MVKGPRDITCVAEAIVDMQTTDSEANRRMSRRAIIRWLESYNGIENMHMKAYPEWAWFDGNGVGLEQATELADITVGTTHMHYHHYSDAGLGSGTISYTGGQGMLAAGPWVTTMLRQHLASPYSNSAEVTAAGTNLNTTCAGNEWLQELHIRLGKPTPFYLDSQSTVFVAKGAAAVKKTVWLTRRAAVLQEGVQHDEILPIHVSEKCMLADPFTKYLKQSVWYRHMRRIHNLPPRAQMLKASLEDTLSYHLSLQLNSPD